MLKVGILGGGQLAQMLTQSAIGLGLETAIFEQQADSPAARLTHHHAVGTWGDADALMAFGKTCDVVTLENEFVDATPLLALQAAGIPVYPFPQTLATIQDKLHQKQRCAAAGIAVPAFYGVETAADIRQDAFPIVLKARYGGYDGYGNVTIHQAEDIAPAWEKLNQRETRGLMVEAFVPFVKELAVMVLRGRDGETRAYPVVETVQKNHVCHIVRCPAPLPHAVQAAATQLAIDAVTLLDGVGIFGVELFLLADDTVLLNEIAPRPHNSGHYTIEGCVTSQFENHLRAVCGLPLGSVALRAPAVVMVNLLGTHSATPSIDLIRGALAIEDVHLHWYGKRESRAGRKMGHITALADDIATAEHRALAAAKQINL